MSLHTILVLFHIAGAVLGAGGATIAEAQIGRALRDKKITGDEKYLLHANYFLIRIGTLLVVASGLALIWYYLSQGNDWVLTSPKIWMKEVMVAAIIVNAFLLTKRWIPFWLGSAISFTSWWGALILGSWRGVPYSFITLSYSYVIAIALVAVTLHLVREHFFKRS